jgi:hypothetical protein
VCPFQPRFRRKDIVNDSNSGRLLFSLFCKLFLLNCNEDVCWLCTCFVTNYGVAMVVDAAVQTELDEDMTVRTLGDLGQQGTSSSYFPQNESLKGLDQSFQNVAMG